MEKRGANTIKEATIAVFTCDRSSEGTTLLATAVAAAAFDFAFRPAAPLNSIPGAMLCKGTVPNGYLATLPGATVTPIGLLEDPFSSTP